MSNMPSIRCGVCEKPYRIDKDLLSGKLMHFRNCKHAPSAAVASCPECGQDFSGSHTCEKAS